MRICTTTSVLLLTLTASVLAQSRMQSGVPSAASGPAFDVSLGYTYLAMSIPGASSTNLSGLDANGRVDLNRFWGATVDSSYVRASDVFGLGHGSYLLSFLVGPVFHPFERGKIRTSIRALAGAGLVDSAVPVNGTTHLQGWVLRPSYALGGGVERPVFERLGIRIEADYLRTAFVNSADTVQPQNNLRLTVSLVLRVKQQRN